MLKSLRLGLRGASIRVDLRGANRGEIVDRFTTVHREGQGVSGVSTQESGGG
jgi:hypothetical protein